MHQSITNLLTIHGCCEMGESHCKPLALCCRSSVCCRVSDLCYHYIAKDASKATAFNRGESAECSVAVDATEFCAELMYIVDYKSTPIISPPPT